ncbi:tripartite tricarboxylate transporter substrate-binding protein [Bosea sp. (in: a-proteobacteria)]|uniref:tripartite tricarboxylate transporter substrate-binding protein n=1 Tax=Bosea sp. (in: a-proteobacteria) TaxID=1871050 RepID=UPI0027372A6D|nr:tripartite tricarboxylate transporter substrate-binding protein [Bosea sp. (in: a-proteobacteria)]MDP3407924.1 tripartite tricarboxylate transporter substrate-binding protein [Bosea sp. (in: a-proteobacteria)]
MKTNTKAGLILAAALGLAQPAIAQDNYPAKTITMIVPFAAGGSSDVIARLVGDEMGRVLGQRIVMENMGGAGGATALSRASRAEPDGYTIVIGNSGTNAASYTIYPDLKYTHADFAPVGLVAKTSPMIALKLDFPAKTLAEFVAYAKANPGKISLGHAGVGSSNYLICRTFIKASGVDVALVSYRGAGPALNDLMGGQIDGVCDAATSLSGAVMGEKVRALVVATPSRLASLPDVPTSAEAGLPAFQAQGWNAIFVPKNTPQPVVAKLTAALKTALASPNLQGRFKELSSVVPNADEITPAFVATLVPAEIEKYRLLLTDK